MGTEIELTKHTSGLHMQKLSSCVTIFREPVSRILSCFYYRFASELNLAATNSAFSCINNMTNQEIVDVLLRGRSRYGRGCMNEPFRIFSGIIDEDMINLLNASSSDSAFVYEATRLKVDSCLQLDFAYLDQSAALLDHFFPRLQGMLLSLPHVRTSASRCEPEQRIKELLFQMSRLEQRLYAHVTRRIRLAHRKISIQIQKKYSNKSS